jgi:hypothetical protein
MTQKHSRILQLTKKMDITIYAGKTVKKSLHLKIWRTTGIKWILCLVNIIDVTDLTLVDL